MRSVFLPSACLVLFILVGVILWALLRFSSNTINIPFIPEIILVVFIASGFFVFTVTRHFLRTRKKILATSQEIKEKDAFYEVLAGGLGDGIWDWDFKTGNVSFSLDWTNMLEFTGHAKDPGMRTGADSVGTAREKMDRASVSVGEFTETADWWSGRIHPDDFAGVKQRMDLYFSGKKPYYQAEYRFLNGKDDYVWVHDRGKALFDEKGTMIRMAGLTSNIQNLKNVEEVLQTRTDELEEAKQHIEAERVRTETMLDSIGEGVIAVDKEGVITMANPAGANMLGLSKEKMKGVAFSDAVSKEEDRHEEEIRKEDRLVYRTLSEGERLADTFHYYRADQVKFPAAVTSAPMVRDGVLSGAIIVFRDMTREMEIDKQKTEFVSLASHQLRTPLSAIRWYSEMVLDQKIGPLNEKQEKYVREVYDSNLRMIDLVNALLNVSRIELGTFAVEPKEVNIHEMFETVVRELEPAMEAKHMHFERHYEDAPKNFFVDQNLMRIVFQNLLSNSVKYTPEGGSISVNVFQSGEYLRVEVADNGYGIPKGDQPKMFSKLFRADNVKSKDVEGTGLGLYIIKSVVEKTGGRIWFESEEDKGTTFFVELPMTGMPKIEGTKGLEP